MVLILVSMEKETHSYTVVANITVYAYRPFITENVLQKIAPEDKG